MQALTVTQLTKVYGNGVEALKGINLSVAEGDFFALLGPNGAGKSTTIGIISSLVNKTAGDVSVFGYNMDTHLDDAKHCIGIVPQELNFNPFEKALDIVINQAGYYGIPRRQAETRAEYYFKKLGLWEKRNQPALRLSGGMKRRLMIARALITDPKLLILDEPTAGVDVELRHLLWGLLQTLNKQGTTIILTTHYLEEAEHLCKNVAIIDHGEIIEHANMKSLLNRIKIQTLICDLDQPLITPPNLPDFHHRLLDELTLEIKLQQDQSLNDLFFSLMREHINIKSLRNKTNRLEELFIDLVSDKTTSTN